MGANRIGIIYNKDMVGPVRDNLIALRDAALEHAQLVWAVVLSSSIVILANVIEELEA